MLQQNLKTLSSLSNCHCVGKEFETTTATKYQLRGRVAVSTSKYRFGYYVIKAAGKSPSAHILGTY
jgi:hypothetical protein